MDNQRRTVTCALVPSPKPTLQRRHMTPAFFEQCPAAAGQRPLQHPAVNRMRRLPDGAVAFQVADDDADGLRGQQRHSGEVCARQAGISPQHGENGKLQWLRFLRAVSYLAGREPRHLGRQTQTRGGLARGAAVFFAGTRAALAWTEALTLVTEGVSDDVYAEVRAQFSEKELAYLSFAIRFDQCLEQAWRRLSLDPAGAGGRGIEVTGNVRSRCVPADRFQIDWHPRSPR